MVRETSEVSKVKTNNWRFRNKGGYHLIRGEILKRERERMGDYGLVKYRAKG